MERDAAIRVLVPMVTNLMPSSISSRSISNASPRLMPVVANMRTSNWSLSSKQMQVSADQRHIRRR